jgi:hypothetical protein
MHCIFKKGGGRKPERNEHADAHQLYLNCNTTKVSTKQERPKIMLKGTQITAVLQRIMCYIR